MRRPSILVVCIAMLASVLPGTAAARGAGGSHEAEREQRRSELRQQMSEERQRWRAERSGERPPPRGRPGSGPWQQAAPEPGREGPGRLSPEERRELRQDLRRHGPVNPERRGR